VGKAVTRNRVKRKLREAWRRVQPGMNPGWDVVVVARPAAANADLEQLEKALLSVLRPLSEADP
jgi:ribonuclease P protein component